MEAEEIGERCIAPCFVNGLKVYDGEINLEQDKNLISNEFVVKLCLEHEVKNGDKVVKKELIIALRDFGNGVLTIYPELDPFLDKSEETEKSVDNWELILDGIDFGDIPDINKAELPLTVIEQWKSLTQEEAAREAIAIDIYKIFSTLEEARPKLDGEVKKEEAVKRVIGEALKEKEDPGAFAEMKSTYELRNNYAQSLKGITYGTVERSQTSVNTKESDSEDEEEYNIKRNSFEAPIYGPKYSKYLNYNDQMDRALALQEVLNPFRKVCVWKKAVGFLGSLPVPLQHLDWKPIYSGIFCRKEDGKGQWHAKIRLTDPYGNIYDQGFMTNKTSRKLSKYHKLSEVMSPN
ncbi:hypothetical protein Tco_1112279 [Tanacetum coccineum]|uniref:Uncharacterized protein n=1 Tax=Tanacetum coccineum TaxID=301880 RepID=A0ABQ5IQ62_9ASTR